MTFGFLAKELKISSQNSVAGIMAVWTENSLCGKTAVKRIKCFLKDHTC
jgi:hypothetical protein